jgi:5-methyltetrahydrofolate--homocysteine methyltransferase
MREPIRFLGENSPRWVSCIPNAGLPINVGGQAVYPLEPEPMAKALYEFVTEFGVSVVGGCCGTGPEHIRAIVEAIGLNRPQTPRPASLEPRLSSGIRAVSIHQEPAPLIIGERVNAQGSRKVKRLLLASDYDAVVQVGRALRDVRLPRDLFHRGALESMLAKHTRGSVEQGVAAILGQDVSSGGLSMTVHSVG